VSQRESLYATLVRLVALLVRNDSPWGRTIANLGSDIAKAANPVDFQFALRSLLSVYGGMGSFSDLVIQSQAGVGPDNDELDRLRSALFAEATGLIR